MTSKILGQITDKDIIEADEAVGDFSKFSKGWVVTKYIKEIVHIKSTFMEDAKSTNTRRPTRNRYEKKYKRTYRTRSG